MTFFEPNRSNSESEILLTKVNKRPRRTKAAIAGIRDCIHEILSGDNPQTVRQVFYALTVRHLIAKLESEYHGTVVRLLTEMRERGAIRFDWIADNTRWQRKPTTFTSPGGKPAHIYQVGDLDPSGVDSARDIEAKLRRYAPNAEIHFERIAVTRQQAEEWNLPTRPTKQTDPRAKKFEGTSVELDAIPAHRLRELVQECIERHVDKRQLEMLRIAEASEREIITRWAALCAGKDAPKPSSA